MRPDVRQFVLGCESCQSKKLVRVKTKQGMIIIDTPSRPFQKIFIYYYGPMKKTSTLGNTHILSIQDWLSKYIILVPVQRETAEETARALTDKFIAYFGKPEKILSDRGAHFQNKTLEDFAKLFKIDKLAARHITPSPTVRSSECITRLPSTSKHS